MRIPFVGPSYEATSRNANTQRALNVYLELDNSSPRAPAALYGTPGTTLRATPTVSSVSRGCIATKDGSTYFVVGSHVYRVSSIYAVTDCGSIGTGSGRVSMATNGAQVLIVDGSGGWTVTGSTLAAIADPDFPAGVTFCTCVDGFFIVTGGGSQAIYWNETPNAGTVWNGLDFASAEGSPDNTIACVASSRELWLFGAESAEVWVNTGSADQLFQRSGNAFIEQGTASAWTVQTMDHTVYWLGSGRNGNGIVFRAEGYTPKRVSNHALEDAIAKYATISDAYAWTYQLNGHSFYVLTFPTADVTWVYDAATNEWHEWGWRNPSDNTDHRHRGACCAFANGKHLIADWETGEVYSLEPEVYTDNGDPIRRLRTTQTTRSAKTLFFGQGILDMETAVANDAFPSPKVMLRYSDDDGKTWSTEKILNLGAVGEYGKVVKIPPTGSTKRGRGRTWELSMTDGVKFALFGADVDMTEGT